MKYKILSQLQARAFKSATKNSRDWHKKTLKKDGKALSHRVMRYAFTYTPYQSPAVLTKIEKESI